MYTFCYRYHSKYIEHFLKLLLIPHLLDKRALLRLIPLEKHFRKKCCICDIFLYKRRYFFPVSALQSQGLSKCFQQKSQRFVASDTLLILTHMTKSGNKQCTAFKPKIYDIGQIFRLFDLITIKLEKHYSQFV